MKTLLVFKHKTLVLSLFLIALFLVTAPFNSTVQAQANKDAAAKGLAKAEADLAKIEGQIAIADSLIQAGTEMAKDGKADIKQAEKDRKALDKEYASNKKPLEKQLKSKDKADVTQAKTEIKALDTKYKADTKALDTKIKDSTKKIANGDKAVEKGKVQKDKASGGLKQAKKNVKLAQEKLDKIS